MYRKIQRPWTYASSCFDLSINKTELLNLRNISDKNLTELMDGFELQTSEIGQISARSVVPLTLYWYTQEHLNFYNVQFTDNYKFLLSVATFFSKHIVVRCRFGQPFSLFDRLVSSWSQTDTLRHSMTRNGWYTRLRKKKCKKKRNNICYRVFRIGPKLSNVSF